MEHHGNLKDLHIEDLYAIIEQQDSIIDAYKAAVTELEADIAEMEEEIDLGDKILNAYERVHLEALEATGVSIYDLLTDEEKELFNEVYTGGDFEDQVMFPISGGFGGSVYVALLTSDPTGTCADGCECLNTNAYRRVETKLETDSWGSLRF